MNTKSMNTASLNSLALTQRVNDARAAACHLATLWPAPSISEYFAPIDEANFTGAPLLSSQPTALFAGAKIAIDDMPKSWMPAYAHWMIKLQHAHDYRRLAKLIPTQQPLPSVYHSIVAGRLLASHGAQVATDVRRQWFDIAVTSPVGAWLAAPAAASYQEHERLLNCVHSDSRLLWAVAQLPAIESLAIPYAGWHYNLPAAFVMARYGSCREFSLWWQIVLLNANRQPEAAATALVLFPGAAPADKSRWLDFLKQPHQARLACQVVRWAQFTWPAKDWLSLKSNLQPICVADRGPVCCQWFHHIAPDDAPAMLGSDHISLLWAVELLASRPALEDYAFRFRLGEILATNNNGVAAAILGWLNQRWKRLHGVP